MCVRRAQYDRVSQTFKSEVAEIAAAPGNKAQILTPLGSIADHRADRRYRLSPSGCTDGRLLRQLIAHRRFDLDGLLHGRPRHHALIMGKEAGVGIGSRV